MTSSLFESWFKEMLLPNLDNHTKQTGKFCIVILDNARFHRMRHLQDIINQHTTDNQQAHKHIILPLPPYSPELNPIESTWATIKTWLRSHLSKFESVEQGLVGYFGVK